MRIVLTLASLLLVLFLVMKLATQQVRPAADAAPGQSPADAAAQKVQRALEQGAAARASDAMAQ